VGPEPFWTTWRTENSCPHRDLNSDPSVVQAVASRYNNCAIPAPTNIRYGICIKQAQTTNTVFNLNMVYAAKSERTKLSPAFGMDLFWKSQYTSMLEKSKPLTFNINRKESVALKSLKDNTDIRNLHADKGNCAVVLNESTCKKKIFSLLESGV
jgi:hypothetical protein